MAFRDDREALLQRVEAMERELSSEQAEHAETESARARLLVELAQARQELARLRPYAPDARPPGYRGIVIAIVLIVIVSAVGAVTLSVRTSGEDSGPVPAPAEDPLRHPSVPPLSPGAIGCRSACDCAGGADCSSGQCLLGTQPAYCCNDPRCPSGTSCDRIDGSTSTCGDPPGSTEEMRAALLVAQPAIRGCIAHAGQVDARVTARIVFGTTGEVTEVALDAQGADLHGAGPCIRRVLMSMTIPPPSDGPVELEAPFVFESAR